MTKQELVGSNLRLAVAVILTAFASFASYQIHLELGREWAGDELIPIFVGPIGFAAVFIVVLLFNWLFRAPYEQWEGVEQRVAELERRLSPRFSVYPAIGRRPISPGPNEVVVTIGGESVTNETHSSQFLAIDVSNITASTLRGCEAYLSRFERVGGEDPMGWQSMRLQWLEIDDAYPKVDIPPHGQRSVIVFKVVGNRVRFLTDRVPGDLIRYLQEDAEYEGLVTLTADGAPATFVAFRLSCEARRPTISIMRGNIGEVPSDVPWAPENHLG